MHKVVHGRDYALINPLHTETNCSRKNTHLISMGNVVANALGAIITERLSEKSLNWLVNSGIF